MQHFHLTVAYNNLITGATQYGEEGVLRILPIPNFLIFTEHTSPHCRSPDEPGIAGAPRVSSTDSETESLR